MKISPVGVELLLVEGQSDRQRYVTKLTVAFRRFAKSVNFSHAVLQESQVIWIYFVNDMETFNAKAVVWYTIHWVLKA